MTSFNDDLPYDRFVVEQLAGDLLSDRTEQQILATAFLRNHPITVEGGTIAAEYLDEYAADRVQTVGTAFLGLSLNCCRCHDHKFDPLTQADFYSLLASFNSITERHGENDSSPAYPPLIEVRSLLVPDGEPAKVMVMEEAAQPRPRRPPAIFGVPATEPQNLLARYRAAPADAEALLKAGVTPMPPGLDPPELAAWMIVANTVLNLETALVLD